MKNNPKIVYYIIFILALAVNFTGINARFFTDDAALYASIAKNLLYKKELFELFTYNRDWLDKPHFPFWVVLFSFKLFGVSVWSYRLPALFFFAVALFYTWLFTKKYYGRQTAAAAVLILATALNTILSNTDVRAEPYLMGLSTGSIYHIASLNNRFTYKHLLLAALFAAFAIMTKGLFVMAAIYGALVGQLLFQKKLKSLFQLKWLCFLAFILIFTLPEFYALYIQFDLHPKKTVFGRQHVSGIRWFLWDSQFGRFVNNGPINRKMPGSIFFYLHTLLWAFAPWCLLLYYAVFKNIQSIYRGKILPEYFAFSGGLLLLLLFSLSRFQLPFYTNAVFPLFAIITAPICLGKLSRFGAKFRLIAQWPFVISLPVAVVALHIMLRPAATIYLIAGALFFGVIVSIVLTNVQGAPKKAFLLSCAAVLFAGFYAKTVLYHQLIPYKGQIEAAEYINQKPFDSFHVYVVNAENNIFQFYCKRPVSIVPAEQFSNFKPKGAAIFYLSQLSMDQLSQIHADFKIIRSFVNYPKENILPDFINKATRHKVLDHVYLIYKF